MIIKTSYIKASLLLLLFSCTNQHFFDLQARDSFLQQLNKMYLIDTIVDHFPPSWKKEELRGYSWSSSYYRCDDYPKYENFRLVGNYTDSMDTTLIDSLEKSLQCSYKCLFSDSTVLKLDVPYMCFESSYKKIDCDSTIPPIYDFRDACFNLGKEEDSLYFKDRYWKGVHEILPTDLLVYIIDAKEGNYWKDTVSSNKEPRPILPQRWKHGYSRGIGISHSCNRVCWWVMAW